MGWETREHRGGRHQDIEGGGRKQERQGDGETRDRSERNKEGMETERGIGSRNDRQARRK